MQVKLLFSVFVLIGLTLPVFSAEGAFKVSPEVSAAQEGDSEDKGAPAEEAGESQEDTGKDKHKVRKWNLPPKQTDSYGNEFVLITEGVFKYEEGEESIHYPFYMQTTEVTQGLWVEVMGSKTWEQTEAYVGHPFAYVPENPVIMVSFEDIYVFVNKLNEKLGKPLYRLPTAREWTYAALAGTTTKFSFGDDSGLLAEYGWFQDNSDDVMPVASLKANPWGLYDMHGNVWELALPEDFDFAKPLIKPDGDQIEDRFKMGGSWMNPVEDCYSSSRGSTSIDTRDEDMGFRLVLDSPLIKKLRDRGE